MDELKRIIEDSEVCIHSFLTPYGGVRKIQNFLMASVAFHIFYIAFNVTILYLRCCFSLYPSMPVSLTEKHHIHFNHQA